MTRSRVVVGLAGGIVGALAVGTLMFLPLPFIVNPDSAYVPFSVGITVAGFWVGSISFYAGSAP